MGGKKNIWLIFLVNVGKYTSPMDPMGYGWKKEHLVDLFLVNVDKYTSPMDPMGYGWKKEHLVDLFGKCR